MSLHRSRSRGFTLIEMLVTLAVFAVLLIIAIPSMRPFLQSQSVKNAAMDIGSTVALARSEAIKRNGTVNVTPVDSADWSKGWSVNQTASTGTIRTQNALRSIAITATSTGSFSFAGNGRMTTTGLTFTITPINKAGSQPLCLGVTVGATGRVESTKVACP